MSEVNHTLGKFCSVAKKGTIIMPKKINGYIEPEGQILEEDGQRFNFIYTPIEYNISYDLDGGSVDYDLKKKYTIEDNEYIPDDPYKDGYMFNGWEPKSIPTGSTGNVKFIATWIAAPVLINGNELNEAFNKLSKNKELIKAIYIDYSEPYQKECINISSTPTKILAYYEDNAIHMYCKYDIICNLDMSNAFEGFTMLKNIDSFEYIMCAENTNINSLFKGCTLLSNVEPVSNWANGKFSDFTDAFTGTTAFNSGRVPSWYNWSVIISCVSTSGKIIAKTKVNKMPRETVYFKSFSGYKAITNEIIIDSPNKIYEFIYEPIEYSISYILNGGEIFNAKTTYTIEDETYYPPDPVKPGYTFYGWDRECITSGEIGNVVFIAQYKSII